MPARTASPIKSVQTSRAFSLPMFVGPAHHVTNSSDLHVVLWEDVKPLFDIRAARYRCAFQCAVGELLADETC